MLWLDRFLCVLLGQMGNSADCSLEGVEDSVFPCGLWLSWAQPPGFVCV